MKEHDFSVLLYSFGSLKLDWHKDLSGNVQDKIIHRVTRVAKHLTSRSLANGLIGLSKTGITWNELSPAAVKAWEEAIESNSSSSSSYYSTYQTESNDLSKYNTINRGFTSMNEFEMEQTLCAMINLKVNWNDHISATTKAVIVQTLNTFFIEETRRLDQNNPTEHHHNKDKVLTRNINILRAIEQLQIPKDEFHEIIVTRLGKLPACSTDIDTWKLNIDEGGIAVIDTPDNSAADFVEDDDMYYQIPFTGKADHNYDSEDEDRSLSHDTDIEDGVLNSYRAGNSKKKSKSALSSRN